MPYDKIDQLYDALKADGAVEKSRENFRARMLASGKEGYENRKQLYDALKADGAVEAPSYEAFAKRLGLHAVKPAATAATAQKPRGGTAMTEADKAAFMGAADDIVGSARAATNRTKRRMDYARANTGLDVPHTTLGSNGSGIKLGQNRHVVATPTYNAETGETEQSYTTESGNVFAGRAEADLEQNSVDDARYQMEHREDWLRQQHRAIEAELDARAKELDADAAAGPTMVPTGADPTGTHLQEYARTDANRKSDKKYRMLSAQLNQIDDALANIEEAKKGAASNAWIDDSRTIRERIAKNLLAFGGGAWRGLVHAVGKVSTWDGGITNISNNAAVLSAVRNANKNGIDNISQDERDLLNLAAINNEVQAENENADTIGHGYKAGEVTGESLPFMLEMILNPASGLGKSAANKLMRYAVKKYGKEAVKKATRKYMAAKIGTRLLGDAAGSAIMAATTGQGHVTADMLNRLTGDVQFKQDDTGHIVYGGTEGAEDSVIKAYMKAFGAQTIENHSEMVGEYFAPFLGWVGKKVSKGLTKMGLDDVNRFIDSVGATDFSKMISNIEKRAHWNGTIGEYAEEVVGNIENALLVGDNTLDTQKGTGVFNWEQNLDTFLGVSLMCGAIAGAKTASYRGPKRQALNEMSAAGKAIDKALGGNMYWMDKWGGWRNTFLVGTDEEKKAALREVMDDASLPINFRMGVLNFVKAAQKYEGLTRVQESSTRDGERDPVAAAYDESYDRGYETADPAARNAAKTALDEKRAALAKQLGVSEDEVDGTVGDAPLRYIDEQRKLGVGAADMQAVIDYANAKSSYDGMIDAVRDDIDTQIEQSDAAVAARVNNADGLIHPATVKGTSEDAPERQVYIVSGNVVMKDDGTGVDLSRTDGTLVIRDAETGAMEMIAPDDMLLTIGGETLDPEEEKRVAADAIREETARRAAAEIDGEDETTLLADPDARAAESGNMAPARPKYGVNDTFTMTDADGNTVRGMVHGVNEDGVEIETDTPLNGQRVQVVPAEEFEGMVDSISDADGNPVWAREEAEQPAGDHADGGNMVGSETAAPSATETTAAEQTATDSGAVPATDAASTAATAPTEGTATTTGTEAPTGHEPTALERVPKNEKGEPVYEQTDPATAWDAIVEQTGGNEEMAKTVADSMVADKEAALKKAEKAKAKQGGTIAEKIAAEQERQAAIDNAKAELKHWQSIAMTLQSRRADAERAKADEARKAAEARAEEEARAKAEREEAERKEREAINGVPDWVDDTPQDARARGFRRSGGGKFDRQQPLVDGEYKPTVAAEGQTAPIAVGKEVEVKFTDKVKQRGRVAVVEAAAMQPSHYNGQPNVLHFIPEAQPKKRTDDASVASSEDIAANINPEEITSSVTAYTGAPTLNARGETIQGNNRTAALKLMWQRHEDQAAKYKQYLMDHAGEFGLNADDIAKMKQPVLANIVDVDDARAIELGQYDVKDTESGGTERIKPKNAVAKMGEDMKYFASVLLSSSDDEASFSQLVDKNGIVVLKWMNQKGYITPTQYKSAFDSKGNLTAEAANDLKGIMYQSIFQNGGERLEEAFNTLPAKAQRAILATMYRDYDSPATERMVPEVQASIMAYNELMQDEAFARAKNMKEAQMAVMAWQRQYQFDDATGEPYLPTEKYSNFALQLAAMYRVQTQSLIQGTFNQMFDLIQGTQEADLFNQDTLDNTPRTLAEAIKEALNIDYNGQQRSNVLAGNSAASQQRRQGSRGDASADGRGESGNGTAEREGGTESNSGRSENSQGNRGLQEQRNEGVQEAHVGLGEKEADGLLSQMEANAAEMPQLELNPSNWVSQFGEEGTVSTPIGQVKMGANQIAKLFEKGRSEQFGMIKPTLENPQVIIEVPSESNDGNTERSSSLLFVKTFVGKDGKKIYYFKSVTVKKDGLEVSVSSHYDRAKRVKEALKNGKLLYRFDGGAQTEHHPADVSVTTSHEAGQGFSSAGKVTNKEREEQGKDEKSAGEDGGKSLFEQFKKDSPEDDVPEEERAAMRTFAEKALSFKRAETEDYPTYNAKRSSVELSAAALYPGERKWFGVKTESIAFHDDANACSYEFVAHKDKQGHLKSVTIIKYHDFRDSDGGSLSSKVAAASEQVNTTPTEAQKEAGNYKKGHVHVGTFDITIEQPEGSIRRGKDADGKQWESKMHNTYGYFRGTEGVDGDHIDVFLSNDIDGWNGRKVFVVDQYNPDGTFDEHKVMLGFNDMDEAKSDYLANYEKGWEDGRRITVTAVNLEDFEKWIASSHRKTKPFSEYSSVNKGTVANSPAASAKTDKYGVPTEAEMYWARKADKNGIVEGWSDSNPRITARHDTHTGATTLRVDIYDENAETPARIQTILEKEGYYIKSDNRADHFAEFDSYDEAKKFADHVDEVQKKVDKRRDAAPLSVADLQKADEKQKEIDKAVEQTISDIVDTLSKDKVVVGTLKNNPNNPAFENLVHEKAQAIIIGDTERNLSNGVLKAFDNNELYRKIEKLVRERVNEDIFQKAERIAKEEEKKREAKKRKAEAKKPKSKTAKPKSETEAKPKNSGQFGLVSDERMEELKKRLRQKLGGQLNMGIDPEILAIGMELAAGHIDRGIKKFGDFAKVMVEDLGDVIRPYLKAFYNGARDMPEVADNGLAAEMTPYDEVRSFDVANFDKPSIDALAAAEQVVAEQEAAKQAATATEKLKEQRNGQRRKTGKGADDKPVRMDKPKTWVGHTFFVNHGFKRELRCTYVHGGYAYFKDLALPDIPENREAVSVVQDLVNIGELSILPDGPNAEAEAATEATRKRFEARGGVQRRAANVPDGKVLRPATDEDIDQGKPVYYDGRRYGVMMVVRSGEQTGAARFSKPKITGVVLSDGREVKIEDLQVERTGPAAVPSGTHPTSVEFRDGRGNPINADGTPKQEKKPGTDNEKKKKAAATEQPGLFDDTDNKKEPLTNDNDNGKLQRHDDAVRTEGLQADGGGQREGLQRGTGEDSRREAQEGGRPDGGGQARGGQHAGPVRSRLPRLSEPKNTRNNHAERGEDFAPKSVDARIDANIKAIELAHELLESGETATPEQMAVLRRFSGWGGLGAAFGDGGYDWKRRERNQKIRELLGNEAYEQAVLSANSAYYTPAYVVDTLWDIAAQLGFKGGRILEGSAGIGNILGQMPRAVSERSDIHAVEIDGTSGSILSLLYPDAKVEIQGFEQTRIPNGSVDLAITNVPFVTGLHVNDTTGDSDLSKKFRDIHDFCIAKNVRKLREGGLGIFITSSGTLDSSKQLREWVVNEGGADFVGAFRMNNKTFGGTPVTSDIIVIRKRVNGQSSPNAIDVSTISGERMAEYDTGEKRKVKGKYEPVVKQLSMDYNKYFIEHPENMAGEMHFGFEKGDTYRPTSKGLYPVSGKEQKQMLESFVQSLSKEEGAEKSTAPSADEVNSMVYDKLGKDVKEGSMVVDKNGRICLAQYGEAVPVMSKPKTGENVSEEELIKRFQDKKIKKHTKAECFQSYSAIKTALNDVLAYQREHEGDEGLQPLLDKLNKAYDDFVKTYGHFTGNSQLAWLRRDVDYANVASVETFEEKGDKNGNLVQTFGKADVMNGRVVEKEQEPHPENVKDGVVVSMFRSGRIDVPYIASQLGMSEEDVKQEIIDSGLGFEDPASRQMEVSYQYLSGNVREKLRLAHENNEGGRYDKNIKALEDVKPMDIPSHLIDFTLGSSWIDSKLYDEYMKDKTDVDVHFTAVGGTWFMNAPEYGLNMEKNRAMGVTSEMLHRTVFGHALIEAAIQNRTITVSQTQKKWDGTTETITDREATQACAAKIDEIRQDFKEWARQKMQSDAEMSQRMERVYNDTFNNYVPMRIPDDFVPEYFGGASHKFKMRPHQGRAIVRGTMQPLLLAHEVGTGKTFTLISTAMEMRRLGTAHKPMIVVQNATVGQFVASAKELYPNAKILTLEDADRNAEGRKNFYAKIKYNDWDMIVVPQSTFEFIPDSEEREMAFVQDKIHEKEMVLEKMRETDKKGNSMILRQAERELNDLNNQLATLSDKASKKRTANDEKKKAVAKQNAAVKAQEMLDRRTDDVDNFDDMGIDALLIDEAHEYKHLGFATAMQRGVKGVDSSYSKKSQGVYLKTQAVLEKSHGRNVIFATGTPISNTAAEIWTFMRYLMPKDTMEEYGIYYFDDFVRNFGNIQQMLEFTTSGKFKENNRFAGYVNLPELVRIWSSVSDTVLTREAGGVKEKIPELEGGKAQDIYLPQTRALRGIMKYVKHQLEEYDKMSGKEKKENSHIPLTMYGIAKAAAVDARLVQSDAEDDPKSKTNEAVRQTLRSLKETESYKGTVAIFADNYQNKHSGFNLYEDIRQKLIEQGVPANEIVVMKSGMTVKKKLDIFDKVNRGEVRVILGSTFTLGTGVNIQERLHTLIHLDAPNRPMDYTQRNGRILRQGNLHKEMGKPVRVLRFGVEDSLDVTAYQRLKTKGAIADSIMNGKELMQDSMNNRVLEEDEDVFGDTVAQLSGSEYAMLKNNAEKNVRKYESRRKQWEADQTYIHNAKPRLEGKIKADKERAEKANEHLLAVQTAFPDGKAGSIKVGKKEFASVDAMADFIKEHNKKILDEVKDMKDNPKDETRTHTLTLSMGGYDFAVKTEMQREMNSGGGQLFAEVHRKMTYSCPELGLENVPVKQSLLRNAIEDITENVITGKDFAEQYDAATRSMKHNQSELEQIRKREGKPFEYEKELEEAKRQYAEYSEAMKKEMEEKEKKYAEMDKDVEEAEGVDYTDEEDDADEDMYRIVDDEATIERLEREPKMTAYRAMQVIDGRLYSPMAAKVDGKLTADNPVDAWTEAEETVFDFTPEQKAAMEKLDNSKKKGDVEIIKGKLRYHKESEGGRGTLQFHLVKGDGTSLWAAYNPYIHSSLMMLNDQFTSAYKRPNIVVVEVEIPKSELTSGYRAERAKDPVGMAEWKAGPVAGQLPSDMGRKVMLSRWSKVKRIVPYSEVADHVASILEAAEAKNGERLTLPIDSFHPELRKELEKRGFKFEYGQYTKEKTDKNGNVQTAWDEKSDAEKHKAYKGATYMDDAAINELNEELGGKWLKREGEGAYSDEELSWENDPVSKMLGRSRWSKRQQGEFAARERERMAGRVQELAERLHLNNVEVVTDASTLEGRRKRAKGFYNKRSGKITIVIPNHASMADVEQTLLHEAVGHYGLRELFGKQFGTFLGEVYDHADGDVRAGINALMSHNGWDVDKATEEYLAGLAEDTDFEGMDKGRGFYGWWSFVKRAFLDMLHKIGFGEYDGPQLSDNELRYILWRSYKNLKEPGRYRSILGEAEDMSKQMDLKVGNFAERENVPMDKASEDDMFRDGDDVDYEKAQARAQYEARVRRGMYQMQEAMQDSMLGLKEAMDAILGAEGKKLHIEDVAGYENAYLGENRLSSVNQAECDAFARTLFKPLLAEVARLAKTADERAELTDYMMAKHGLERNEVMARRAADKKAKDEIERIVKKLNHIINRKTVSASVKSKATNKMAEMRALVIGIKNGLSASDAQKWYDRRRKAIDTRYANGHYSAEQYKKAVNKLSILYNNGLADWYNRGFRGRDYSGLTALTGMDNVVDAELEARRMVADYESSHSTDVLWGRVNDVTNATLSKTYESGLISKATYDDIRQMYKFYIPLRGFDEKTSGEAYAYLRDSHSAFNAPIKTAKGRKSKADDPFANMESMAESAIMQGNRNVLVKQKFLNFVLNHPSDLVSVSDLWLRYDDAADEWKPVNTGDVAGTERLEETDSPAEVERKMRDFEAAMEQLATQEPDKYVRQRERPDVPYRVVGSENLHEHQVVVKRGGRDYLLTINGNPRAAQALNGKTNPDAKANNWVSNVLDWTGDVNRTLSMVYTTLQPDFVTSNFLRDTLYANSMVWVKESPEYARKFNVNYAKTKRVMSLLGKLRKGTLDMNNETERQFKQFMENGGETGYMRMADIEEHKKEIQDFIDKVNAKIPAKEVREYMATWLGEVSRGIEMRARFAAYLTSRQMRRSIDRSIWDAKEISVNFNKKGAGDRFIGATGQTFIGNVAAGTSGAGRALYLFWNAAIQGTFGNFGKAAVRHPGKMAALVGTNFMLGLLVTALAASGGGDDDDSYYDLPEHVRRQNFIVKGPGKTWIKVPLPQEFRAVYGLGELAGCTIFNNEKLEPGKMAAQVTQLLPIDAMEGWQGAIPSSVKPAVEVARNESWYGSPIWKDTEWNKHMPQWTKAYKNANPDLVNLAAVLNEMSGGSKYKKGAVDMNPAAVEYLLKQYTGGIFTVANQVRNLAAVADGDKEFDWRYMPLLNRTLMTGGDERNAQRGLNEKFFLYMDRYDAMQSEISAIKRDGELTLEKKAELIGEVASDKDFMVLRRAEREYSRLSEALKKNRANGLTDRVKELEKRQKDLKQRVVKDMEE